MKARREVTRTIEITTEQARAVCEVLGVVPEQVTRLVVEPWTVEVTELLELPDPETLGV